MAARKEAGQFVILASESSPINMEDTQKSPVKRGVIIDAEKVGKTAADLVRSLNRKLYDEKSLKIERFYLGYGGQGLHNEQCTICRNIGGETVTNEDLESVDEQIRENPTYANIISKFVPYYYLDGVLTPDPVGHTCQRLEVRYQLLVGHKVEGLREIIQSRTPGISLESFLASPTATAYSTLDKDELENGCALVEIGAGVTTLSIYRNNNLMFLVTIPLGGYSITHDICSLKNSIPFDEAETQKVRYGEAYPKIDISPKKELKTEEESLRQINNVISWRVHEIARNVDEQIIRSGFGEFVNSIVLTGGTSQLKGIDEVFRHITGKPVRRTASARTFVKQSVDEVHDAANVAAIGMFALAKDDVECCTEIQKTNAPTSTTTSAATPTTTEYVADSNTNNTDDAVSAEAEGNSKGGGGGLWGQAWGKFRTTIDKVGDAIDGATKSNIRPQVSVEELSPEEKARRAADAEKRKKEAEEREAKELREREEKERQRQAKAEAEARQKAEREAQKQREREEKERKRREEEERKRNQPSLFGTLLNEATKKIDSINNQILAATGSNQPTSESNEKTGQENPLSGSQQTNNQ